EADPVRRAIGGRDALANGAGHRPAIAPAFLGIVAVDTGRVVHAGPERLARDQADLDHLGRVLDAVAVIPDGRLFLHVLHRPGHGAIGIGEIGRALVHAAADGLGAVVE